MWRERAIRWLRQTAQAAIDRLPEDAEVARRLRRAWNDLRRGQTPQRVLAPVALNVAVHGALALLLAIAWTTARPSADEPAREFVLTLQGAIFEPQAPDPVEIPADDAPRRAREAIQSAAAAIAEAPRSLPELTRLAPPGAALPSLESLGGSARDPAGLLGRSDARVIGSASFAGVGAEEAGSVVYVVDASGAMITSLPMVIDELQRSISALKPTQQFQVVMFRDRPTGSAIEVFNAGGGRPSLARATERNKRAVFEWLQTVRPLGSSNPVDGLRRGLEFRPDAIFLLARSIVRSGENAAWGRGREAILAELDGLNPVSGAGRRRVQIKTIQFIDEDPSGVMRAIGEVHGGGAAGHVLLTLDELRAR